MGEMGGGKSLTGADRSEGLPDGEGLCEAVGDGLRDAAIFFLPATLFSTGCGTVDVTRWPLRGLKNNPGTPAAPPAVLLLALCTLPLLSMLLILPVLLTARAAAL